MEFRILGPIEVVHNGKLVALRAARQRAVVGLLVLNSPRPVSPDRLVDELWGDHPPRSALHAIQVYISEIRTVLRTEAGSDSAVRTSSSGYALDVADEDIDARSFERLVGEALNTAARDPLHARSVLEQALALWRGPVLADIENVTAVRLEADRLDEVRLVATECLLAIRLDSGEDTELVGTLKNLVAQHPLREKLCRQLMLALYRDGRQSEALAAYQNARVALDELGLVPSRELRDLQQAILRHDQSLDAARSSQASSWDFEPKDLSAAERNGAPFLVIRDAEGKRRIRMLDDAGAPLTIGRVPETDVSLEWDGEVSRLHAQLEPIGSEWTIIDDGLSTNGTFLNGRRIAGRQRLIDGDALRLGRSCLTFRHPAQAGAVSTIRAGELPVVGELSATRRGILVALCRPLKQQEGFAAPATDEQIAAEISLGVDAVNAHLSVLCQRFDLDDVPQNQKRARLAELALELGIVARSEL
ncbi:MAG TPA: BTAD domain-containing putative transcriptional regulator [Solirubrobacteraceae bacterium]|nr:BTAD domain-containing putative transcriptional regulator [Solirubrobacteraceae bacterium]